MVNFSYIMVKYSYVMVFNHGSSIQQHIHYGKTYIMVTFPDIFQISDTPILNQIYIMVIYHPCKTHSVHLRLSTYGISHRVISPLYPYHSALLTYLRTKSPNFNPGLLMFQSNNTPTSTHRTHNIYCVHLLIS
jgi:hypothetical protein